MAADEKRNLQEQGTDLPRTADTPMGWLRRQGNQVTHEDIWPTNLTMGGRSSWRGEVGILQYWWNDTEQQQWRWWIELYNIARSHALLA